jgi:hypothetical protein
MTELPLEAQRALISFLAALLIGGPVALFGASNVAAAARIAGGFALRHRLSSTLGLGLIGGTGLAAAWPF